MSWKPELFAECEGKFSQNGITSSTRFRIQTHHMKTTGKFPFGQPVRLCRVGC